MHELTSFASMVGKNQLMMMNRHSDTFFLILTASLTTCKSVCPKTMADVAAQVFNSLPPPLRSQHLLAISQLLVLFLYYWPSCTSKKSPDSCEVLPLTSPSRVGAHEAVMGQCVSNHNHCFLCCAYISCISCQFRKCVYLSLWSQRRGVLWGSVLCTNCANLTNLPLPLIFHKSQML